MADRMGLVPELRRHDLDIHEMRIVDDKGRRVTSINQQALGELTGGKVMSLPRSAVALGLYEALPDRVAIRLGETVTDLREGPGGVAVQFSASEPAVFDLVVGADGLHSAVRRLAFGPQEQFERFLGYHVAAFSARDYPHRDPHVYVTYGRPGRQIWRISADEHTTVFMLVFADGGPNAFPQHDLAQQKRALAERYAHDGWEAAEMLEVLEATPDLYVDRVSQIVMPAWSRGRIALIGDACACPSLLAGEGSAMAMAEAYTLAGELHRADDDAASAFAAFERKLRPYVERKQKAARSFAASFAPKTALGLWARNATLAAASALGLTRLLLSAQLNDRFDLETYGKAGDDRPAPVRPAPISPRAFP